MRNRAIWLIMAVLAATSLGIAFRYHPAPPSAGAGPGPSVISSALRFVPETYEFGKTTVLSGDRIRFEAFVENTSNVPVRLTAIPRSCGCLTFGEQGDLKLPVLLQPAERFPLRIEAATDGKTGFQTMHVQAQGTMISGESVAPATLNIRGRIWSSIQPLPEDLYVEVRRDQRDSPIIRTVLLADEWPGTGLAIDKIHSTAGRRMRFSLAPASGNVLVRGLDVRKRHRLTITYTIAPDAETFDEMIMIIPALAEAKAATVRLHGRVLPDYEFRPERLFVYGIRPGTMVRRILAYHPSRPEFGDVRLIEAPENINVEEMDASAQGVRRFLITCRLPENADKVERVLVFQVGKDGTTVRIPVTMIVDPATMEIARGTSP